MAGRRTLTARYPKREQMLADFSRRGPRGVLFIKTGRRLDLAEQVNVLVEFAGEKRTFRLFGKVVSRRRASEVPRLPAGVEVEFPAEENQKLQLVLDHAEGKEVEYVARRSRRLPCSFVVAYRRDEDFIYEFAEDIGEGGTFIRTDKLLPVGTEVECRLKPPGFLIGIKLRCRVIWLKAWGYPKGMGVEFIFASLRQQRKVRALVGRLAKKQSRQALQKMKKIRQRDRLY